MENAMTIQEMAERLDFSLMTLAGFAGGLLDTPPEMPLTEAEEKQVREAMSAIKEARRHVAAATAALGRIVCAVRDRHKNN